MKKRKRTGMPLRRIRLLLLSATMLMSVTGCAAFTKETKSDCCIHLEPIYFSSDDTAETQEQVIDYLITYESLCGVTDGE
jgi:hypothetical protein